MKPTEKYWVANPGLATKGQRTFAAKTQAGRHRIDRCQSNVNEVPLGKRDVLYIPSAGRDESDRKALGSQSGYLFPCQGATPFPFAQTSIVANTGSLLQT